MLRRPGSAPALVIAGCALLAASSALPAAASPRLASTLSAASPITITARSAATFTALAFPDPAAGWVLGQAAAGPARAQVWHTSTAGATWQLQWQGAGSPVAISATDSAHAWALVACRGHRPLCGRELLATSDGGQHWRVIARLPQAVNQVQFYSDRLGLAVSDSCLIDFALTQCPGRVLISRDGGARWTQVLRGAAPVFATATAAGRLWAAQTVPSTETASGPTGSDVKFLTSTDGGHIWHRLGAVTNLGPLSPVVRISLAANSSGLAWASVYDQLSCAMHGCGVAELLHSGNGGRTWSPADLPDSYPDECGTDGIAFSAAPDGSLMAATGRNGAACSPPLGLVYSYGPSGWLQLPPWQLTQISALDVVSQDVAYALSGEGVLSRTSDGGYNWRQVLPAPVPAGQVDALSATRALAAQDQSDAGAILRTDNGGRSWTELASLPGVLTQLHFWSADYGFAVSYDPDTRSPWLLWMTQDGGSLWAPFETLPQGNTDIYGPWISPDGDGLLLTVTGGTPWAPGSGGVPPVRIWTTGNYGLNWTRGALLPFGHDTLEGPASFAPYSGSVPGGASRWSGWLAITTASFAERVAVTDGGPLRLLPASIPVGYVQLISPGTGFAWGLEFPGNSTVSILSLARTTNSGRSWQRSSIRLVIPANLLAVPLLDFSDANHGWLILGYATWHTSDGGRTWTRA
jgi:photosystem II stability/assembly factor-like uncharacterized protein